MPIFPNSPEWIRLECGSLAWEEFGRLRLLHTSDWHLGHRLHGQDRVAEHDAFLEWLLTTLESRGVDVLLITGDIFDNANPAPAVLKTWYGFLARLKQRLPRLQVVVIGGNHDSPGRLDAANPVLDALDITVIGGVPRHESGLFDAADMTIPLKDASGKVAAWCGAMPFIRVADLPPMAHTPGDDRYIEGVRFMYRRLAVHLFKQVEPGQAVVFTGHCQMAHTVISEDSERKILGSRHALPADVFPPRAAYVALGHLHRAQRVDGREDIRYAGSPIPLSLRERDYEHQVLLLDFAGDQIASLEKLNVPRTRPLMVLPADEPEAVLTAIEALPERDETVPFEQRPLLGVTLRLALPRPGIRKTIEEAMAGKQAVLLKIDVTYPERDPEPSGETSLEYLRELEVEQVFLRRWRQVHDEDPPAEMTTLLGHLLQKVHGEER